MRSLLVFLLLLLFMPALSQPKAVVRKEEKVRSLLLRGKAIKARALCDAQLGRTPQPQFYALRAEANNKVGDHVSAQRDARLGMVALPGASEPLLQLAIAQQGLGQGDSAIAIFQRLAERDPSAETHYRLALAYQTDRDPAPALLELRVALAKAEGNVRLQARIHRAAGECQMQTMDTSAARISFERSITLDPDEPVSYNSRGWTLFAATGQHQKAIADYDRALKLNPNYSYAFNNRGWSRYKLGEKEKALADIQRAKRRKGTNPYVYRNLGIIALDAGDKANACIHFRTALDYNFTLLFGNEVQELMDANCAGTAPKAPPGTTPNAPQNKPVIVPPTRTNAP
jgi:tetratricopeptide (TPR) repeat protein